MTTYNVQPGTTFQLTGTLAQGYFLDGLGGKTGPGAVIEVAGNATNNGFILVQGAYRSGSTAATLHIAGTLTNGATGIITAENSSYGYGPNGIPSGVIVNDGLLINLGTITLGDGSDAAIPPARLIDNGVLQNSGLLQIGSYYVEYHGSLAVADGVADINGVLTNDGRINVLSSGYLGEPVSTLNIAGTLTNLATGNLYTYKHSGSLIAVTATGTLANAGTIALDEGFKTGPSSTLAVAGVLTNSGTIIAQADQLIKKSQGAHIALSGSATNTGLISIEGANAATSKSGHSAGATLTDTGALANSGRIVVHGGLGGSPSLVTGGAGVLIDAGSLNNAALGTIALYGSQPGQHQTAGATFQVTGILVSAGLVSIGAGAIGTDGMITGPGAILTDTGTIKNQGSIDIATGANNGLGAAGLLNDAGRLLNTGHITIGAGGSAYDTRGLHILASGSLSNAGTIVGAGKLLNDGQIGSGGAGVTSGLIATAQLINDAVIKVAQHSAFTIDSAITAATGQTGTIRLGAAATLTLGAYAAATQTITFAGNDATLALADERDFHAILDIERPHATLDLLALAATAAATIGTTLTITPMTGAPLTYTLAHPLDANTTLTLTPDGHGGTDLAIATPATTFSTPPPHATLSPLLSPHLA